MKRLIWAAMALVLLLLGCGKEIGESVPNEIETMKSCITIRVLDARTDFGAFTAEVPGEGEASSARALAEGVLSRYPAGFAEQWGEVEFLLAGQLTGEEDFAHGSYAAFTQREADGWLVVLDVTACDAGTVHHEIAHILDGILTDAGVLTEAAWMEFCPGGFRYGQPDREEYADFFADAYAMENMKEDRARTFEEAVQGGPGVFAERPALWLKLEYFSRAIRSHFDTEGWPEKTIWELALG